MKVKYEKSTGKIIAIGSAVGEVFPGTDVIDLSDASPADIETHVVDKDGYRQKTDSEKDKDRADKIAKKNSMKAKLAQAGIDKETLEAIKTLNPEDL